MKSRIKWYVFLLIFALGLQHISYIKNIVINFFKDDSVAVSVYTDDICIADRLNSEVRIGNYKLHYGQFDSDIIITHDNINDESYQKLDVTLYTPVILYINVPPSSYSFTKMNDYYICDYKSLINGLTGEKCYSDIGIDSKKTITIHVPDEGDAYYETVVSQLSYSLMGEAEISYTQMKQELEDVFSRMTIEPSIYVYADEINNHSEITEMFFAPEMLYERGLYPVYDTNNTIYTYNVYVKKERADSAELIAMFSDEDFFDEFILRSTSADYVIDKRHFKNALSISQPNIIGMDTIEDSANRIISENDDIEIKAVQVEEDIDNELQEEGKAEKDNSREGAKTDEEATQGDISSLGRIVLLFFIQIFVFVSISSLLKSL